MIQSWSLAVGDRFRGVAIAEWLDGELTMIQCGHPAGFERRTVADLVERYNHIGVGKRADCRCRGAVVERCRASLNEPNHYPLVALLPAFLLSWARNHHRLLPSRARMAALAPPLSLLAAGLGSLARITRPNTSSFICSTFIDATMDAACPQHRLEVVLTAPKPEPGTQVRASTDPVAELLRSWYLTPSDLWRALAAGDRFLLAVDQVDRLNVG